MVGYRNYIHLYTHCTFERISFSDGGISELTRSAVGVAGGAYQLFRWWDIGTGNTNGWQVDPSVSAFPMVGYRNRHGERGANARERISFSDGGISKPRWCVSEIFGGAKSNEIRNLNLIRLRTQLFRLSFG